MVANKAKADAYVRIHANGSTSPGAHGAMTICTTPGSPFVSHMYKKNRKLSEDILDAYVERTGAAREYIWETDSMSGNNWSQVPTTILEMGYMIQSPGRREHAKQRVSEENGERDCGRN